MNKVFFATTAIALFASSAHAQTASYSQNGITVTPACHKGHVILNFKVRGEHEVVSGLSTAYYTFKNAFGEITRVGDPANYNKKTKTYTSEGQSAELDKHRGEEVISVEIEGSRGAKFIFKPGDAYHRTKANCG